MRVVEHERELFFMKIDEDGVSSSLDGRRFGDNVTPGSFSIGVGATKDGAKAHIRIRTPTPREPGP